MASCYLNGEWPALEEARISVLDRGFLFGDGVYEVIPVYGGRPFCLERHLERLANSLSEVRMPDPMSTGQWRELILEAVLRSGESLASIYLQVTRGAEPQRSFVYPAAPEPTVFIMVNPAPILARDNIKPYSLITLEDFRWNKGHIKTVSLIAAGILKNQAIDQGADDAILIKEGFVTEATASNLFFVFDGVLTTPPRSDRLLHGITRDVVLELGRENNMPVEERPVQAAEIERADEIFISSSTHETWPVTRVDDQVLGNGEPGPVWRRIDALYAARKVE